MTETNKQAEAEVVAKLAREHEKIEIIEIESPNDETIARVASIPVNGGRSLTSVKKLVDEWRTEPERRGGTAELLELESFIEHANRFKDEHSALFAVPHPTSPFLLAVLDYHQKGADGDPRWCSHRGRYAFPLSEEWSAWTGRDRKPMDTASFAAFVEERLVDVVEPGTATGAAREIIETLGLTFAGPARLLELSRGITIHEGTRVQRVQNLASGEAQIAYASEHTDEAGAPLRVPSAFLLELPVFKGDAAYQLAARLRYRLNGGSLTWFYELYRPDRLFDDAFKQACKEAQEETGLPLFKGMPENGENHGR